MTEQEQREAVVKEMKEWAGTPFIWGAVIKGKQGGCDCASFLAEVYGRTGVFNAEERGYVSPQWALNQNTELYLRQVVKHAVEICQARGGEVVIPQPGDFALTHAQSKTIWDHGGIVEKWPVIWHCYGAAGVHRARADMHAIWANHVHKYFSPWKKVQP